MSKVSQGAQALDPHSAESEYISDSELIVADPQAQSIENLRLLWDNRGFLCRCTAAVFLIALAISFLIPTQYQSTTLLMPPDSKTPTLSMLSALSDKAGAGAGLGLSLAGGMLGKSSGELFVGILRSRTVSDDVINRFDLRKAYWLKHYDATRKKLTGRTDISEDAKTGIISITVNDTDPRRAAAIAQFYADDLNKLVSELSTSSAHRERVFLEGRLKGVKAELDSAAIEFSQFASRNTAIDVPEQGKAMVESAARLQGELIAAQSELSGLEQIYSGNNIRVRSLRAKIDELQHQLELVGGESTQVPGGASPSSLYPSIRQLPLLGVTYADLYRKVKLQEAIYESLTKEYEIAKVEEAKEIPTVRVLDPANIPEHKSFPPRFTLGIIGAMLTFVLSAAWVLVRDRWSRLDIRDPTRSLLRDVTEDLAGANHEATHRIKLYFRRHFKADG